jgi:large subunit ribosomal protein L25
MSAQQAVQASQGLVGTLPVRLRNFFAKFPPEVYSAHVMPRPTPPAPPAEAEHSDTANISTSGELPSPYTPSRDAKGTKRQDPTAWSPSKALLYSDPEHPNPFLPRKIFRTGRWSGARIGLRQQADLVKLAKKYGVEQLLPPGRKSTEFQETRRAERGLAVKGTGIGQKVKGHKWERTMETRLEDRRKAMLEMPELIRQWQQVSIWLFPSVSLYLLSQVIQTGTDANLYSSDCREVMEEDGKSGPGGSSFISSRSGSARSSVLSLCLASISANFTLFSFSSNRHWSTIWVFHLWEKGNIRSLSPLTCTLLCTLYKNDNLLENYILN